MYVQADTAFLAVRARISRKCQVQTTGSPNSIERWPATTISVTVRSRRFGFKSRRIDRRLFESNDHSRQKCSYPRDEFVLGKAFTGDRPNLLCLCLVATVPVHAAELEHRQSVSGI
jgi:hypothetical protein